MGIWKRIRKLFQKEDDMDLLRTLICALEAGDPNLDGHSLHVHYLVSLLYEYLPPEKQRRLDLSDLRYASLFFDMGKLGIPRKVLARSGKLEPEEMALVQRHPEICVRILGPARPSSQIWDWILYHHERFDGSGYHGLKGEEIPLASRMIAVADTYSALTRDRTYKATMSHEEAIAELRLSAGTQLDGELVACFCEIPLHRVEECFTPARQIMERCQNEHIKE